MSVNYRDGLRKAGTSNIEKVEILDMCNEIGVVNFKLREFRDDLYLNLINADNDYFSIKVGGKVQLTTTGEDQIRELVNEYVVYTGVTENGRWFTFGPEGTSKEPIATISFSSLFPNGKVLIG